MRTQRIQRNPTGEHFEGFRHPIKGAHTELVFVRHGQTAANIKGLLAGRYDVMLTELGHEQAQATADHVKSLHPHALVTSPLQRTRQTAAPIGLATGMVPVIEDDIAEFSFGELEGWSEQDALATHPHLRPLIQGDGHPHEVWPGGESASLFITRIFMGIGRIINRHQRDRVVVVSHGGVIGSFAARLASETETSFFPYLVGNCSISTFTVTDEGTTCLSWNERDHLDGLTGHET